jgi:hypothetical protein
MQHERCMRFGDQNDADFRLFEGKNQNHPSNLCDVNVEALLCVAVLEYVLQRSQRIPFYHFPAASDIHFHHDYRSLLTAPRCTHAATTLQFTA